MINEQTNGVVSSSHTTSTKGMKPYIILTKPMLNFLVVITSGVGFILASSGEINWLLMFWTLTGTLLAALAAATLNQLMERGNDAQMQRTQGRPLPSGQVTPVAALILGTVMSVMGVGLLAIMVNWLAAFLAALTLVLYLAVYTPLKKRSNLCTLVGALSGAIPPLIGYVGAAGRLDYAAWTLAALLFVWQIPHFLALAWRFREDYSQGGFKMLSAVDRDGRLNSHMLLIYSMTLLPISLAPVLAGLSGRTYFVWALILGHGLMALSSYQNRVRTVRSARIVFLASVIYLPIILGVLVWDNHKTFSTPALAVEENSTPESEPPHAMHDDMQLNGFDLSYATIPLQAFKFGAGRDSIPAFTDPDYVSGKVAAEGIDTGGHGHGKFLVPGERVIGVTLNGESRAYPVRILNWHEVVNDSVGGQPVCVTYCPLCDSAATFDRNVGGEIREFGVSGLLYNSNLLMYDRGATGSDSLWSQIRREAVSGPAAKDGATLDVIPCELTYWEDWFHRHPHTTVITGDNRISKRYKSNPYGHYYLNGDLMFPVDPLPPADSLPPMTRVIAIAAGDDWKLYAYQQPNTASSAQMQSIIENTTQATLLKLPRSYGMQPEVARLKSDDDLPAVIYTFWFAWHAMYPGAEVDRQLLGAVH